MTSSLVGSEMCIRDRSGSWVARTQKKHKVAVLKRAQQLADASIDLLRDCLLYTSDAADDM
eukprot:7133621-Prorocentrum_lima.AAC.1